MLTGLWTPKGGSGTTVTACALARLHDPALIIDTAGDVPAVLGPRSITADATAAIEPIGGP